MNLLFIYLFVSTCRAFSGGPLTNHQNKWQTKGRHGFSGLLGDSPPLISVAADRDAFLAKYDMQSEESHPPVKEVTVYLNNYIIQIKKYEEKQNFDLKIDLIMLDAQHIPTDHSFAYYVDQKGGYEDFPSWLEENLNVGSAVSEKVYEVLEEIVWAYTNDFDIPVLGYWSSWEPWGSCDSSNCPLGRMQRVRHCIRIKHAWCRGSSSEQKNFGPGEFIAQAQALKSTAEDGNSAVWSAWSSCSATCGSDALKRRSRRCDSNKGLCTETMKCDLPSCTAKLTEPVVAAVGAQVSLYCSIMTDDSNSIVWYDPDGKVIWGERYATHGRILKILKAKVTDGGTYMCASEDSNGNTQRATGQLVVRSCLISNPCLNGGMCTEFLANEGQNKNHQVCQCLKGYSGEYCQIQEMPNQSMAPWKIGVICGSALFFFILVAAFLYGFVRSCQKKRRKPENSKTEIPKAPDTGEDGEAPDLMILSDPEGPDKEAVDSLGYLIPKKRSSQSLHLQQAKYRKASDKQVKLPKKGRKRSGVIARKVPPRKKAPSVLSKFKMMLPDCHRKETKSVKSERPKIEVLHPFLVNDMALPVNETTGLPEKEQVTCTNNNALAAAYKFTETNILPNQAHAHGLFKTDIHNSSLLNKKISDRVKNVEPSPKMPRNFTFNAEHKRLENGKGHYRKENASDKLQPDQEAQNRPISFKDKYHGEEIDKHLSVNLPEIQWQQSHRHDQQAVPGEQFRGLMTSSDYQENDCLVARNAEPSSYNSSSMESAASVTSETRFYSVVDLPPGRQTLASYGKAEQKRYERERSPLFQPDPNVEYDGAASDPENYGAIEFNENNNQMSWITNFRSDKITLDQQRMDLNCQNSEGLLDFNSLDRDVSSERTVDHKLSLSYGVSESLGVRNGEKGKSTDVSIIRYQKDTPLMFDYHVPSFQPSCTDRDDVKSKQMIPPESSLNTEVASSVQDKLSGLPDFFHEKSGGREHFTLIKSIVDESNSENNSVVHSARFEDSLENPLRKQEFVNKDLNSQGKCDSDLAIQCEEIVYAHVKPTASSSESTVSLQSLDALFTQVERNIKSAMTDPLCQFKH